MKLSILCQSPVVEGRSAAQAVHETVALARAADALGYHRFWVAEHHSDRALASASPEVMISHLASITTRMRIGSGGVLLPYYSPFKVAEQFNLLEVLFPGRIDLGLGRAGGSEGRAPQALRLRPDHGAPFADVDELLTWLGPGTAQRVYPEVFAAPGPARATPVWILGSSPVSARYAAARGLPYAFGAFLDPRHLMAALATYHQYFQPSRTLERPQVMLAWFAVIGESEQDARQQAACSEAWFVDTFLRGHNRPFPTMATALAASHDPQEQAMLMMKRQACSVGTAAQVLEQLHALTRRLAVDEVMVVSITDEPARRLRGYELLAEAAGLGAV
jgi:luciferase family oxidoreductase group 1